MSHPTVSPSSPGLSMLFPTGSVHAPGMLMPAVAGVAVLLGLAGVWRDTGTLAVVAAVLAFAAVVAAAAYAARRRPAPDAFGALLLALGLVLAADFLARDGFAWTPYATGLAYAPMVAGLWLLRAPLLRAAGTAANDEAAAALPAETKWLFLALLLIGHGWLVIQIGRGNLPHSCALALFALLPGLHAGRALMPHREDGPDLAHACRLGDFAILAGGLLLALGLLWNRA